MLIGRFSGPSCVTSTPLDLDPAGARLDEAADHAQQRGLAAAGRPEDRQEIAARNVEVERQHRFDLAEALADAAQPHRDVSAAQSREFRHARC